MPIVDEICNWLIRMLQQVQDFWAVLVDMFLHDFQLNLNEPALHVHYRDIESRQPDYNFDFIQENMPLARYTIEHEHNRQEHESPSTEREENLNPIVVPVLSRLEYIRSCNNRNPRAHETTPLLVILEPRPLTESSEDITNSNENQE